MIQGKTIFSWNVPTVEKGDPIKFTQAIVDGGFEGVLLKGGEGNQIFRMRSNGPFPKWGNNIKPELVEALRAAKRKVYIWHFVYGADPKGELDVAEFQCNEFRPDGYIWDAESIFDAKPTAAANARLISKGLKESHPDIPQALCWWALPLKPSNYNVEWHPVRVARAFMETVDCVMPMMYWSGREPKDAIAYLKSSLNIWRIIGNDLPIIPVGRAYTGDGGEMDPAAITSFAEKVMELRETNNLQGISWWSLDKGFLDPDAWKALKGTPAFGELDSSLNWKLSERDMVARLVAGHRDLFPELFNKEGESLPPFTVYNPETNN